MLGKDFSQLSKYFSCFLQKIVFEISCKLSPTCVGSVLTRGILFIYLFIPHHTVVAGYYGFTLVVGVYVRSSVVRPFVRIFVSGR